MLDIPHIYVFWIVNYRQYSFQGISVIYDICLVNLIAKDITR